MIKVYNTMFGGKEELQPRREGEIGMYVCGPTVYNYIHVGNGRAYLTFDIIKPLPAPTSGYDVHPRPEHHRRGRQDHQPRRRRRATTAKLNWPRRYEEAFKSGHAISLNVDGARRDRLAPPNISRRWSTMIEAPGGRSGHAYAVGRGRILLHRLFPWIR